MRRTMFARLSGAILAALTAIVWTAAPGAAQTGSLTGTVVDATSGAPINGAQVSIEGTTLGGLSNAQGRFLILNVPTGSQTVRVTYLGYRTEEQTVSVTVGEPIQVTFRLQVSAVTLDEVVVTGTGSSRSRRPAAWSR